ncbi:unnamed protein product [Protopolystoma xenopodis]|uniref:Transmembrane protein n=1 Tax=Protopolystoma xenopodis TaxID=117903 RepID=A0A448XS47_9PLAT|nr:unnamed protein product [Protopolystoma xenopodis]
MYASSHRPWLRGYEQSPRSPSRGTTVSTSQRLNVSASRCHVTTTTRRYAHARKRMARQRRAEERSRPLFRLALFFLFFSFSLILFFIRLFSTLFVFSFTFFAPLVLPSFVV